MQRCQRWSSLLAAPFYSYHNIQWSIIIVTMPTPILWYWSTLHHRTRVETALHEGQVVPLSDLRGALGLDCWGRRWEAGAEAIVWRIARLHASLPYFHRSSDVGALSGDPEVDRWIKVLAMYHYNIILRPTHRPPFSDRDIPLTAPDGTQQREAKTPE